VLGDKISKLKIITFKITSEGGECLSLMDMKRNGIEYMWCGNSKCTGTKRQVMAGNVK